MSQVAELPAASVTVNWDNNDSIVVFSGILENVILNAYSAVAPGSPTMDAPLFVLTEFALYWDGRTSPIPLFPVNANVNFDELDLPVIVNVPPVLETVAVAESKLTNSGLPD